MSKLNIFTLVHLTTVVDVARTGVQVSQDPPVRKAARQFRDDVAQATRSGGELVIEARGSYNRHSKA